MGPGIGMKISVLNFGDPSPKISDPKK